MLKLRVMAILAALAVLLTALPVAAESAPVSFVMAGYDGRDTQRDWANNAFFTEMTNRTGVSFTFQQAPTAEAWRQAKADMAKPNAQLPDVLFKAALSRGEEQALYDAGALLDLRPLLEENAPHLWQILAGRPDILEQISLPGGQIVSLPYLTSAGTQNCMWINQKWLTQLKLDMPTDLASLENVMRAFKTRDPNMNGGNDEIPLSFLGIYDLNFLSHAFGFIMNDYHIYAEDGAARFAPLTDEYLSMIRWLRDMYREGLLDRNGFYTSDQFRAITSSDSAQTYGIFLNAALTNLVPADWLKDYQLLMPLTCDGKQRYRSLFGGVTTGTFAITSACGQPERLLGWVDTLYTLDGAVLASLGRENVDYVVDGDGTWRLTESFSAGNVYAANALINSGTAVPGISSDEFQLKYSDSNIVRVVQDTLRMNTYCELPFPVTSLTEEQAAYIGPLQNKIGLETDLQASRWILGEDELTDESVDSFRDRLTQLGVEDFMAFWQERLDEWKGA